MIFRVTGGNPNLFHHYGQKRFLDALREALLAVFISSWTRCLTAVLHYDWIELCKPSGTTVRTRCKWQQYLTEFAKSKLRRFCNPEVCLWFFLLIKFALLKWLVLPLQWGYNVGVCMLKASCDRYSLRLFNVHSLSVLGKVTFKSNALQYCVTP